MKRETRSHAAVITALTLALSGAAVAGCGGDSGGGGPWDAFVGRWFQISPLASDPLATGFTLSCTDPRLTTILAPAPPGRSVLIFPSLVFEHGELTDLAETSGNCSPMNYDISGKNATLPSPDPYIDDVPGCGLPFTAGTDINGLPIDAVFILLPSATWTFSLLDEKTPAGGDQGRLVGTAKGHVIIFDTAAGTPSNPDCDYAGSDTYVRLTQP